MRTRLASLDGLRAASIAMVVSCHAARVLSLGRPLPGLGLFCAYGPLGVTVFFVISGFLITTLLLDELAATGDVRLGAFYGRRAFRILPAYWVFLGGIAALTAAGWVENPPAAFRRAFFFLSDYLSTHTWSLGHSWSLSVEEQFYLFWPALLVGLGPRRAKRVAIALIVLAPAARLATLAWLPTLRSSIGNMMHTRVDALMVGCLAALLRRDETFATVRRGLGHRAGALAAAFLFVGAPVASRVLGPLYQLALGYSLEGLAACVLVLWAIDHADSPVGRALNARWVATLGTLSYSLYLWQEPLLDPALGPGASGVALRIAGAVGLAWLSYRFVEKPFLAMRARLSIGAARVHSSSTFALRAHSVFREAVRVAGRPKREDACVSEGV